MTAEPENRMARYTAMIVRAKRIAATTGLVLVIGSVGALLPLVAHRQDPREVTIVVHRMAFYLGQDRTSPNPTIRVAPGERIRIRVISEDSGFEHDFAIDAWRLRTLPLHGDEETSVIFQAPEEPGSTDYVCTMHAAMMRGKIEVAAVQGVASSGY